MYCYFGLRLSFNVSNMQLGDGLISWSNKFKYLGVMFNVEKTLSIDLDVIRRNFFAACNCILGILNTKIKFLRCVCKSRMIWRSFSMLVQQLDLPSYSWMISMCAGILCIDVFLVFASLNESLFYSRARQTRLSAYSLIVVFKIYKMCSVNIQYRI